MTATPIEQLKREALAGMDQLPRGRDDMKDPISRSFKKDFPQFVERATALGVSISLSSGKRNGAPRAYWLDGYRQLTGYILKKGSLPFTHDDAVANIDKALTEIEQGRAGVLSMSRSERFAAVMAEMRKITPQYRMIGEVHLPSGDKGHCFFMHPFTGDVNLHGVGTVAKAKAEFRQGENDADQFARFCDLLEADHQFRDSGPVEGRTL
jgi:hypothetical protein